MPEGNGILTQTHKDPFVTTRGDRVVISERQHWFVWVLPISITLLVGILLISFIFAAYSYFPLLDKLFIATGVIIVLLFTNFMVKTVVEWYFHFYIVTTRKILEATYAPLFSHNINEVLLEQVRCTEVDIKMEGILSELIDMGSITVTFDRPTHQEEFLIANVRNPNKIGMLLGDILDVVQQYEGMPTWYRDKNKPSGFRFSDQLFPVSREREIIGGNFI